ncbi:MAG: hypothetical protein M1514_01475 [Patescibacteria group bacterium]|nr:hypothetical protein [Patescibacteria group bacterium]
MKKAKVFYDHLTQIEELFLKLEGLDIEIEEKEEIIALVDDTFHRQILTIILDHLPREFHENFLHLFSKEPESLTLLNFLKEKITKVDIEEKIISHSIMAKRDILFEIRRSVKK